MGMEICIHLSDVDLQRFAEGMRRAQSREARQEPAQVLQAARGMLQQLDRQQLPDFVLRRFDQLGRLMAMLDDQAFAVSAAVRAQVLATLDYLAQSDDLVPDEVPLLGYIDDAIMIELCLGELAGELTAYATFCRWREDEASRHRYGAPAPRLDRAAWQAVHGEGGGQGEHVWLRQREGAYLSEASSMVFRVH